MQACGVAGVQPFSNEEIMPASSSGSAQQWRFTHAQMHMHMHMHYPLLFALVLAQSLAGECACTRAHECTR
eukprot:407461-Alexandrium_andersonii.AAC.1